MGCLGSGNDWGVGNEREMDTWVWNQVGLELVKINIEGTIESEGGSDRRNNYKVLATGKFPISKAIIPWAIKRFKLT